MSTVGELACSYAVMILEDEGIAITSDKIATLVKAAVCLLQAESENPKLNSDFATMSRSGQPPDLKKYMDKKLQIKLNANRMVTGTLRGFDQFMNLVVDNTVEVNGNDKTDIGMVVIRGNSIVTVEALEPVGRSS
jgi:small nuclear ribonucleoprotein G